MGMWTWKSRNSGSTKWIRRIVVAHQFTNSLIHQKSPYLLQHAHNPVNWVAWENTQLETAAAKQQLLIISIGYAACHWCHVMEAECFENSTVAAFMNAHFIP